MSLPRKCSFINLLLISERPISDITKLDEMTALKILKSGEVPQEMKSVIRATFDLFDADRDGHISTQEIKRIMGSFGLTSEENKSEDILHTLDTDGSGSVEYSEFESFVIRNPGLKNAILSKFPDEMDREMIEAFRILDRDGDGYIDKDELRYFMTKLGDKMDEKDVNDMIKEADLNGDGKIDYSEYVRHIVGSSKT